jgi:hypothetical protein
VHRSCISVCGNVPHLSVYTGSIVLVDCRLVCGRITPMQLQRRSTPRKRESPLLAKEEIRREMADINFACDLTSM